MEGGDAIRITTALGFDFFFRRVRSTRGQQASTPASHSIAFDTRVWTETIGRLAFNVRQKAEVKHSAGEDRFVSRCRVSLPSMSPGLRLVVRLPTRASRLVQPVRATIRLSPGIRDGQSDGGQHKMDSVGRVGELSALSFCRSLPVSQQFASSELMFFVLLKSKRRGSTSSRVLAEGGTSGWKGVLI
jgi:hypothetical protein